MFWKVFSDFRLPPLWLMGRKRPGMGGGSGEKEDTLETRPPKWQHLKFSRQEKDYHCFCSTISPPEVLGPAAWRKACLNCWHGENRNYWYKDILKKLHASKLIFFYHIFLLDILSVQSSTLMSVCLTVYVYVHKVCPCLHGKERKVISNSLYDQCM